MVIFAFIAAADAIGFRYAFHPICETCHAGLD
jgi:hypothetical protein